MRDFKEDVKLDKYNLDKCALEQPELYAEWGEQWANAVNVRDRAKDRLALIRSECDEEIRSSPGRFGWAKADKAPTEAFISSAICGHEKYIEANDEYLDACHNVNVLAVAKESFEQRRKMIEVLVQLYVSSYYSGNKDLDKSYHPAVEKMVAQDQSEGLERNPRLQRRRNVGNDN